MEQNFKCKLNDNLILRENDKTLFSITKMEIYEFNDSGFEILKLLRKEMDYSKLNNLDIELPDEEILEFVDKLIVHGIIDRVV